MCMYMCLYMHTCMGAGCACVPWGTYVRVRGQLVEVGAILPSCGSQIQVTRPSDECF